jgi:hypothetical protein
MREDDYDDTRRRDDDYDDRRRDDDYDYRRREDVPNYLVQAILVTLFCCLPFGIVAIVYAASVNGKLQAGDYRGARAASDSAKTWCWVSFGLGLVANLIVGAIQIAALSAMK